MLVLDLSESMSLVRRELSEVLSRMYRELSSRKMRIGVVGLREDGAFVVCHPTDVSSASRAISSLEVSGLTPLASGLAEALRMASAEALRRPGSDVVVAVLTDGYPNVPLSGGSLLVTREQRERAFEDAVEAALALRRAGVRSLFINPDPVASAHRLSPSEARLIYAASLDGSGRFSARLFERAVSRLKDPFAVGSALTAVMALAAGGEYSTPSSPGEIGELLRRALPSSRP